MADDGQARVKTFKVKWGRLQVAPGVYRAAGEWWPEGHLQLRNMNFVHSGQVDHIEVSEDEFRDIVADVAPEDQRHEILTAVLVPTHRTGLQGMPFDPERHVEQGAREPAPAGRIAEAGRAPRKKAANKVVEGPTPRGHHAAKRPTPLKQARPKEVAVSRTRAGGKVGNAILTPQRQLVEPTED